MLAVALWQSSQTAAVLACGALLALSFAFAGTLPLGARLRRERLEFAWWIGHGDPSVLASGVVAGAPFEVRCYVRNRSARELTLRQLLPVVPDGTRVLAGAGEDLVLAARARSDFAFRLATRAPGRVVLQGLAVVVPGPFGLFHAPLYFPSPISLKALPKSSLRSAAPHRFAGGQAVERAGLTPLRRRGSGMELHEVRELRPGDPFRSIAWKPSARAGRLLVREVEHEVQETLWLVLDVSGTMRGGAIGERKLDHGIELTAVLAKEALERGDRVGVMTVDGRIVSQTQCAEGPRHMLRVHEALLAATEVVDADLTEADDDAVAALVGRYFRQQEGVQLSEDGVFDTTTLATRAKRALQTEAAGEQAVAGSAEHAVLRRFCQVRGIALPYRAETRAFGKAAGLAQALRTAAGSTRAPRALLCVTDFDGAFDLDPLLQALRLLRARQHSIAFVVPDPESLLAPTDDRLERTLRRVYGAQERRRIAEVRRALLRIGVPLLYYDTREGVATVLQHTQGQRRVA
jgi:uncharacterized protein (DUF58 family)